MPGSRKGRAFPRSKRRSRMSWLTGSHVIWTSLSLPRQAAWRCIGDFNLPHGGQKPPLLAKRPGVVAASLPRHMAA